MYLSQQQFKQKKLYRILLYNKTLRLSMLKTRKSMGITKTLLFLSKIKLNRYFDLIQRLQSSINSTSCHFDTFVLSRCLPS